MLRSLGDLLLRVRKRDRKSAKHLGSLSLFVLAAAGVQSRAIFEAVKSKVHRTIPQIRDDVLGLRNFVLILFPLGIQKGEVKVSAFLRLRVGLQFAAASVLLASFRDITHSLLKQSQLPMRKRKIGQQIRCFRVGNESAIVLGFLDGTFRNSI